MEKDKNLFFKQLLKFLTLKQNIILFSVLLVIFVVIYFVFTLNPNDANVTWIFSSSMQTLAALIALLPISYSYYLHNIEAAKKDDYDNYIIKKLEKDVYYEMMFVIIYSLIIIIYNLINLFLIYSIETALLSGFFTVLAIQLLVIYIYRLFDPERVNNILRELDKTTVKENQIKISLDQFITQYLNLETTIKDYISNENDNELIDDVPLYNIVDNLSKDFPEINKYYDTFKEIIFHRNNLIHNYHDVVVDYSKYERIIELIAIFKKHNEYFVTKNIFTDASNIREIIVKTLNEYLVESNSLKAMDGNYLEDFKEDIISLFRSHFVSNYYFTRSLADATDTDFEIIQNNYSNRKIVGIDIRTVDAKLFYTIATSYFNRLNDRYLYLFIINYDYKNNAFDLFYRSKTKGIKSIRIG